MKLSVVITTINRPTRSVFALAECLSRSGGTLVVIGDSKGPDSFDLNSVDGFHHSQMEFHSLNDQLQSRYQLGLRLPTKHYSRKNLGYLCAIAAGTDCLYETDDDNAPLESWVHREEFLKNVSRLEATDLSSPRWVNVYKWFSDENIWPRGLPLDQVHTQSQRRSPEGLDPGLCTVGEAQPVQCPIQQGLVNGSPDVDAVWRLTQDREFAFDNAPSVLLPPGNWCPFNTQTTWWWPVVYPLLYIPSHCSFRMCDIWKSFVAQRCLWELGLGVVFHAPEVYQDRNEHHLMSDFKDEVPGYIENHRIAEILEGASLDSGADQVASNFHRCYEALVRESILPTEEMILVETWLSDLRQISAI